MPNPAIHIVLYEMSFFLLDETGRVEGLILRNAQQVVAIYLQPPTLPSSHLALASLRASSFAASVRTLRTQSATS